TARKTAPCPPLPRSSPTRYLPAMTRSEGSPPGGGPSSAVTRTVLECIDPQLGSLAKAALALILGGGVGRRQGCRRWVEVCRGQRAGPARGRPGAPLTRRFVQ